MKVDIYQSKKKINRCCFVQAGTKKEDLPDAVKNECDIQKDCETMDLANENLIGVNSKEAIGNIKSNGYHLQKPETIISEKAVKSKH